MNLTRQRERLFSLARSSPALGLDLLHAMRWLTWKNENNVEGWGCSNCPFMLPNPQSLIHINAYVEESLLNFFFHECNQKSTAGIDKSCLL